MQSNRVIPTLLFICLLVGCSTIQSRPGEWRLQTGQRCVVPDAGADTIPITSLLTDVAPPAHGPGRPSSDTLLVTVRYDTTGVRESIEVYGRPKQEVAQDEFVPTLERYFVETAAPGTRVTGQLVRGAPLRVLPNHRKSNCSAALINRAQLHRNLLHASARANLYNREAVLRLFIDADGIIQDAYVHASSGSIEADALFLRVVQTARFAPALLDGFALPVWVQLPLGVRGLPPESPDLDSTLHRE